MWHRLSLYPRQTCQQKIEYTCHHSIITFSKLEPDTALRIQSVGNTPLGSKHLDAEKESEEDGY